MCSARISLSPVGFARAPPTRGTLCSFRCWIAMVSKSNSAIIRRSSANHHSFRALIWYKAVLPKRGVSDMATIQLEAIGSRGFSIIGNVGESAGWAVSSAGDVNGDGFDDLI